MLPSLWMVASPSRLTGAEKWTLQVMLSRASEEKALSVCSIKNSSVTFMPPAVSILLCSFLQAVMISLFIMAISLLPFGLCGLLFLSMSLSYHDLSFSSIGILHIFTFRFLCRITKLSVRYFGGQDVHVVVDSSLLVCIPFRPFQASGICVNLLLAP